MHLDSGTLIFSPPNKFSPPEYLCKNLSDHLTAHLAPSDKNDGRSYSM